MQVWEWFSLLTGSERYLLFPHWIPTEALVMSADCSRVDKVSRGQSGMVASPLMYQGLFEIGKPKQNKQLLDLFSSSKEILGLEK